MANRIVGNVIIVDSAMGNLPIVGGTCVITEANTATDVIAQFSLLQVGTGVSLFQAEVHRDFPGFIRLNDLKCPLITTGSACIYLV